MRMDRKRLLLGILVIMSLPALVWAYFDYRAWHNLGAGGVPHNVLGWAMITAARPLKIDPHEIGGFEQNIGRGSDLVTLNNLPKRSGARPDIAPHPIPHRQLTQLGAKTVLTALQAAVDRLVQQNQMELEFRTSRFETHNAAVWLRHPASGNPDTLSGGEIAHVHPSDGSMHVILSPSDAKIVMEAGWGELHPISGYGPLAPTYMLLYSARTPEEVQIIEKIVSAGIAYAQRAPVNGAKDHKPGTAF